MSRINYGDVSDFILTYAWVPAIIIGGIAALLYFRGLR